MKTSSKFSNLYVVYETLGEGNFGIVKRCVKKSTGQEYAVKIIKNDLSEGQLQVNIYILYIKVNERKLNRTSYGKQKYAVNCNILT